MYMYLISGFSMSFWNMSVNWHWSKNLVQKPIITMEEFPSSRSDLPRFGGWTNPSEKYARQNGNLPQVSGWKFQKMFEWNHHLGKDSWSHPANPFRSLRRRETFWYNFCLAMCHSEVSTRIVYGSGQLEDLLPRTISHAPERHHRRANNELGWKDIRVRIPWLLLMIFAG